MQFVHNQSHVIPQNIKLHACCKSNVGQKLIRAYVFYVIICTCIPTLNKVYLILSALLMPIRQENINNFFILVTIHMLGSYYLISICLHLQVHLFFCIIMIYGLNNLRMLFDRRLFPSLYMYFID